MGCGITTQLFTGNKAYFVTAIDNPDGITTTTYVTTVDGATGATETLIDLTVVLQVTATDRRCEQ